MYELIDFGEGRRLERFGAYLLDRPAAGTEGVARDARVAGSLVASRRHGSSKSSGSSFPQRGRWIPEGGLPETWIVEFGRDSV